MQKTVSIKRSLSLTKPKREPLSRLWFLSRGYTKADPKYVNGYTVWLHPETNDALNQYGQKIQMRYLPSERHRANTTRYLVFNAGCYGDILFARLKYLTFKGDIPKGYVIDHIDGNSFDNNIRNLRAVTPAINARDGGFLRKLRNKGIRPEDFSGVLLDYFDRMAEFKETHTYYAYRNLSREKIMRILVGPKFTIVSPDAVDDLFPEI